MWDLIVSFPDHCLSFYFLKTLTKNFLKNFKVHDLDLQVTDVGCHGTA